MKEIKDFIEMMERFVPHNQHHPWVMCYHNIMTTNQYLALKTILESKELKKQPIRLGDLWVIWILTPDKRIIQNVCWHFSIEEARNRAYLEHERDINAGYKLLAITRANAQEFYEGEGL